MQINFDHINTSQISETILNELNTVNKFNSNTSSEHSIHEDSKLIIENSRTTIAKKVDVFPGRIIFSSDEYQTYTIFFKTWKFLDIKTIISSHCESTLFLHLLHKFAKQNNIKISFVDYDQSENLNLSDLEKKINSDKKTLIHLSHINLYNSKFIPVKKIIKLSKKYNSLLSVNLSNSLPIVGISLNKLEIDFAFFSSDQFHGLNGIQAIYMKYCIMKDTSFYSLFGHTKRKFNASNIFQIKAFAMAITKHDENFISNQKKIIELKSYFITKIQNALFNNEIILMCEENSNANFFVLSLPYSEYIVQKLDSKGIAISSLTTFNYFNFKNRHRNLILVSFSKYNTFQEIDYFIKVLEEMVGKF